MYAYESGKSEPPVSKLIQIAELFEVSVQDLIFTDLSREDPQYEKPSKPYSEQEESKVIAKLNNELRKRVMMLEDHLKRADPDLAERWGIE